jgi:ACT domain-containing protein
MSAKDDFFKQVFESYFHNVLIELLPKVMKNVLSEPSILKQQDMIPLCKAVESYDLSRKTFYNYHDRGYITLRTSGGKTFVSMSELENHIRSHPLPRKE